MFFVTMVACTILWLVMQGGNKAGGKGLGTAMGCMLLLLPLVAIACIAAVVVIPFLFTCLPILAFIAAITYIASGMLFGRKPAAKQTGSTKTAAAREALARSNAARLAELVAASKQKSIPTPPKSRLPYAYDFLTKE